MYSKSQLELESPESSPILDSSFMDLEMLLTHMIIYSPPQLLLSPLEPADLTELENDVLEL